jgi:hypothetical protein
MHCRFDAGHGEFSNGVALRQHYDTVHAGEYMPAASTQVRGVCSACGQGLKRSSWSSHKNGQHPRDDTPRFVPDRIVRGRSSAVSPVPAVIARPEPSRPAERHTAGLVTVLSVDDIVLPAIQGMAYPGNAVPVAALGALFAWRDATAVMLREVSGDR